MEKAITKRSRFRGAVTRYFQKRIEGIIPTGRFWWFKLAKLYLYIAGAVILIKALFFV